MPPRSQLLATLVALRIVGLAATPPIIGAVFRGRRDVTKSIEIALIGEKSGRADREHRLFERDEPLVGNVDQRRKLSTLIGVMIPLARARLPILLQPHLPLDGRIRRQVDVKLRPYE